MEKKLKYIPYGQAKVRDYRDIGEDMIVLQSYSADVIIVHNGWFECTGLYSMTTRKHISAFMREYFPQWGFQLAKEWAGSGKKICLETGEIR